jgi:hypothetical protein
MRTLKGPLIALTALVLLFPLGRDWWLSHSEKPRSSSCLSNMKQIAAALIAYSADHGDLLPPPARYYETLLPYERAGTGLFVCPEDSDRTLPGYALSRLWVGHGRSTVADAASAIMAYEASGESPAYRQRRRLGGYRFVVRYEDMLSIGYVDGHAKYRDRSDFGPERILGGYDR